MACRLGVLDSWLALGRESVCVGFVGGAKRELLRRVLDASRVEVCNGLPGSGECIVHGFPARSG